MFSTKTDSIRNICISSVSFHHTTKYSLSFPQNQINDDNVLDLSYRLGGSIQLDYVTFDNFIFHATKKGKALKFDLVFHMKAPSFVN